MWYPLFWPPPPHPPSVYPPMVPPQKSTTSIPASDPFSVNRGPKNDFFGTPPQKVPFGAKFPLFSPVFRVFDPFHTKKWHFFVTFRRFRHFSAYNHLPEGFFRLFSLFRATFNNFFLRSTLTNPCKYVLGEGNMKMMTGWQQLLL